MMRAWLHRRWPRRHRFDEAFKIVDAVGNIFIGCRCRCGVVNDSAWQWTGSIFPSHRTEGTA